MGKLRCRALPFFYAVTGSDETSSLHGLGKRKAWEAWKFMPEITNVFAKMGTRVGVKAGAKLTEDDFDLLQRFFNIAYRKSSPFFEVNLARQAMFADGVAIENCPPSKGALKQHILRAILLSRKWHKALELRPELPSPSNWGWNKNKDNIWVPHWSDDLIVADALQKLIRCGCKKRCSGNCTCCQYGLPCTPLCKCYLLGCSKISD